MWKKVIRSLQEIYAFSGKKRGKFLEKPCNRLKIWYNKNIVTILEEELECFLVME